MALYTAGKEDYIGDMIKLENVTKYFKTGKGRKYILKDVSIELPGGKNIGILGRNGAGKSTTLRMLGGIEFPNSGRISADGTFSWPMAQSAGFIPNMSAKDNIKFVCRIHDKNEEETRAIIESVRAFAEIGDYFDMPMRTYSSGMKGRVNFGLSLAFDFDYLLIDETLATGDAVFKEKAKRALDEKISRCNILLVNHGLKVLQDMCDVGLMLHNGQLYYFDSIDEAIREYRKLNEKVA
jgi:capsular polysaccharide transport system ATP-binding protein